MAGRLPVDHPGDDSEASTASDVWSLGATLYHAVEGRPPFTGNTSAALLFAISQGTPAPTRRADRLTPVLGELLCRDPHRRPTAEAVVDILNALTTPPPAAVPAAPALDSIGPDPGPPFRRPSGRATWARVAASVVVLVTAAVCFWGGRLAPIGGDSTGDGTKARGVPPGAFDAFSWTAAGDYTRAIPGTSVRTVTFTDLASGQKRSGLGPVAPKGLNFLYRNVDFGHASANRFQLMYQSAVDADPDLKVELRLDDSLRPSVGQISLVNSYYNGKAVLSMESTAIPPTTGSHDVYLRFVHEDPKKSYSITSPKDTAYIFSFYFWIDSG